MNHMGKQSYLAFFLTELKHIKSKGRPVDGWIRSYRIALGIPQKLLAKILGLTPTGLNNAEEREKEEAITLKTLRRIANAMDCDLHYAFIPRHGTPETFLRERAKKLAERDLKGMKFESGKYEEALHERISYYVGKKVSEIWKVEEQKLFGKKSGSAQKNV